MTMSRYLSPAEVVRLAREAGEDVRTADREALYLALRRTAEGNPAEVEARIHEFAASLLEGLLSFHPFTMDNERVALHAVARFYEVNGWVLDTDAEVLQLVDDMQSGRASVFTGAAVLERRASRSPASGPR